MQSLLKNKDSNKNKYYLRFWVETYTHDDIFPYLSKEKFNDLDVAINKAREEYNNTICFSVEIIDSNKNIYFSKNNGYENFYFEDKTINFVSAKLLFKYIDCWAKHKDLPIKDDLLYCKTDNKIIALDNSNGDCWVEEFDNEIDAKKWLLGIEEGNEMEM